MAIKRYKRTLLTESYEFISSELFSEFSDVITQLIGKSSGVYALFNNGRLYYVGRAKNLKSRVKQHLNDKHKNKWTHFSLYLIGFDEHIGDIESLLVRIALPKGNVVRPRGNSATRGERKLRKAIKRKFHEKLDTLVPRKSKSIKNKPTSKKLKRKTKKQQRLVGHVERAKRIYRTYKGKRYKAILYPSGTIKIGSKKYLTPTAAAMSVIKGGRVNGWAFWRIQNKKGEWVKLKYYKK